jgi:hypothetical protein
MDKKQQIKEAVTKWLEDNDIEASDMGDFNLDDLSYELDSNMVVDYRIEQRQGNDDMWYQAEVWVTTKGVGLTVIIDYDVNSCYDTIDELVDELYRLHVKSEDLKRQ